MLALKDDSALSSGGQGKLTFFGLRLRQDCRYQHFVSYLHVIGSFYFMLT
jgi:hypothetical protein